MQKQDSASIKSSCMQLKKVVRLFSRRNCGLVVKENENSWYTFMNVSCEFSPGDTEQNFLHVRVRQSLLSTT